jgi:alpha-glucosidase (family GH31 glycosyl hydrolase)
MPIHFRPLLPNTLRVTHSETEALPPERPWVQEVLLPQTPLTAEACQLVGSQVGGVAHIHTRAGKGVLRERAAALGVARRARALTLDISATELRHELDVTAEAVRLAWEIQPGEGFYGWGEWFSAFRRERGAVKLKIRDAIPLIQHRETYSAIPVFVSDRGYAVWLLNSYESVWTLDPDRGLLEVVAAGPGADYVVLYGPSFQTLVQTYTALTGRPPLAPKWALGLMVTGYPQEPQAVIEDRARLHRQKQIPLDAIILDYHWEEHFHNFQWRKSIIPNPPSLIANLLSQGIRLGLIFTPFINQRNRPNQRRLLNTLAGNVPAGEERHDDRALPEYEYGLKQGYFAHPNAKWWLGAGGMMDFSNPAACAWWNGLLRPLYDQGVAFFKNDDGEYLPRDARGALGMEGREYHNLYGFFYSRAIYDGMKALDDRRPFVYARSAWAGTQRYPALFLGDQKPTGAHILSTLRAALNLSLLGYAYWTADVFGLDGQTTPEMHMRYAQYALLAPVARYFWRPPAVDDTRFPWSHNAACEANFKHYTELRYRLLPYYYVAAWQAYLTGLPIVRPLLFEDPVAFKDVADQALVGDSVLFAPVTQAGATTRAIRLPAGTWHDFWTAQTWRAPTPQTITYPAPLERLPLLVRGGSILPSARSCNTSPTRTSLIRLNSTATRPTPPRSIFTTTTASPAPMSAGTSPAPTSAWTVIPRPSPCGSRPRKAAGRGLWPTAPSPSSCIESPNPPLASRSITPPATRGRIRARW